MARGSGVKGVLAWAGVVVWCLAPVGAYWLLTERSAELSLAEPIPVDGVVRENDGGSSRDVTLVMTWHSPPGLVAPEWSGLVQAVSAQAGGSLSSGDAVAKIAGVDRLACASDHPMANPVALKDKGPDVETLHQCLTLTGHDVSADKGVYGQATKQAVEAWSARTGAASEKGTVFDPAWLIYLPAEDYQLGSVDLQVAVPAPAPGSVIATAEPALARAVLASPDLSGDTVGFELEGEPAGAFPAVAPDDVITAGDDESLLVGKTPLELSADRAEVAIDALPRLSGLAQPNASTAKASLEREASDGEFLVPAAAVVATPRGETCVLRVAGGGLEPVTVAVADDKGGSSIVTGELKAGDLVRITPPAEARSCASK
ncbi:MAG: hypothetical protein LBG60_00820 [Bifidobacteriaceae bacterium]|jgi:peptidoglycan hydrolase-like protein with peptidoglycan-binding domain|nr:hypothetical protein [Bifidobacteriaceae bacterium]